MKARTGQASQGKCAAFRSLYLAPTKALIADQQGKFQAWTTALAEVGVDLRLATLTGDTAGDRALLFRPTPDVLLSNPDCINNLLYKQNYPQFEGLKRFLRELRFIVIDEVQSFTGSFGCNSANLLNRIRLAVKRAGGDPEQVQFVLASATVGNPQQVWQTLCSRTSGHSHTLIEQSTAPFPGRVEVFCNGKKSSKAMLWQLVNALMEQGLVTILFVKSRRMGRELVHLIRREQRRLGKPERAVDQFHGTLSGNQRRDTAQRIREGSLKLIVATSALEQGVDFPQIDAAIVWGFPGINQLQQRFGRAGRGTKPGIAVFVPNLMRNIDQYYARQGRELAAARPAAVHITPGYIPRLKQHILAAAGESGIQIQQELIQFFGEAGAKAALGLKREGKLYTRNGYLVADRKAALGVAMRGSLIRPVELIDAENQEVIEEFSHTLALREVHPGAIYTAHDQKGRFRKWRVKALDLEQHQALAEEIDAESPFTTRPVTELSVELDLEVESRTREAFFANGSSNAAAVLTLRWGTVTQAVTGYDKLLLYTRVACNNPECRSYRHRLPPTGVGCERCGSILQVVESRAELVSQQLLEVPLRESYQRPILTVGLNGAAIEQLKQCAGVLKGQLYAQYEQVDQIPPWHENLMMHSPEALGVHTLCHLLLMALPTQSQPIAASDLLQMLPDQPAQVTIFDDAEMGTGSCEFLYEEFEQLLSHAYYLAAECDCQEGCPKCCHTDHCEVRNGAIYRPLGGTFLAAVLNG